MDRRLLHPPKKTGPDEPWVPWRSPTLGVNVVVNHRGTFVQEYWDGVPSRSHGPFEQPMSLPEALHFVATNLTIGD